MPKHAVTVTTSSPITQGTITLTDDQIRNAADHDPIEIVPGVPGQILFPMLTVLTFKNVADYSNINGNAFVRIQTGGGGARVILEQIQNGNGMGSVNALFALGNGNSSMAWIEPTLGLAPIYALGISSEETYLDAIGKPLSFAIDNQGQGFWTGGDPANALQIDVVYFTITPTL